MMMKMMNMIIYEKGVDAIMMLRGEHFAGYNKAVVFMFSLPDGPFYLAFYRRENRIEPYGFGITPAEAVEDAIKKLAKFDDDEMEADFRGLLNLVSWDIGAC